MPFRRCFCCLCHRAMVTAMAAAAGEQRRAIVQPASHNKSTRHAAPFSPLAAWLENNSPKPCLPTTGDAGPLKEKLLRPCTRSQPNHFRSRTSADCRARAIDHILIIRPIRLLRYPGQQTGYQPYLPEAVSWTLNSFTDFYNDVIGFFSDEFTFPVWRDGGGACHTRWIEWVWNGKLDSSHGLERRGDRGCSDGHACCDARVVAT